MKTYQPQLTGAIMFIEADDGEWVKRSDYTALAAELEAVKLQLATLRQGCGRKKSDGRA